MPQIIEIEDWDDERIADYRNIRERDLVGRRKLFIAEGLSVLNAALNQDNFEICSVLFLDKKRDSIAPCLARLPGQTPVFTARSDVMDEIAGFHIHRGILAIAARITEPAADDIIDQALGSGPLLLLSGISNHDNMGGIFRNAAAFGAGGVLLDNTCCDPLYRKAIRVSVGGVFHIPFARLASIEAAIEAAQKGGFVPRALSPSGERNIASADLSKPTAFILGAEGTGLSAHVLNSVETLNIDIEPTFDSLYVAVSSAIALHQYRAAHGRPAC